MKKVKINVTLYFNEDLEENEVESILEDVDYSFKHQWIKETVINGINDM